MHGQAYPEARETFFGPSRQPVAAPMSPTTSDEVLAEFRARVAPNTYNAQHPGSFSYFTPPPLPMSIAGEVLSQWIHQGVDVWHAGPIGAFVEEEVTGWLRDLVGFREDGWGVLTSGGVMANIMAMTLARDVWLAKLRGTPGAPRGSDLERVRVYASDQTHFSIGRALDVLGFPEGTLRVVAVGRAVPAARRPGGRRHRRGPRGGPDAARDRRRRGLHQHGVGRRRPGHGRPVGARVPVAPRRRRLRRGRAPVPARRAPRAGTGACRQRHDRPAQVVLPGLRHRRPDRAPARGPADGVPPGARVLPFESTRGRTAALVPVLHGGDAPVPWLEAVDELEAPGHRGSRPSDRAERRPGGLPRRADVPRPTTSRRTPRCPS